MYERKPLRDLNWKKIIFKILKTVPHWIGIGSIIGTALFILVALFRFWNGQILFLYEFDMTIVALETFMAFIA